MTLRLFRAFTSAQADSADPTQIQPSHWNADISHSMASLKFLGRRSAGAGPIEEIVSRQWCGLSTQGVTVGPGLTRFFNMTLSATEAVVWLPITRSVVFRNLYVYSGGSPGAGQSFVFTLRNTSTDTAITCTIGPGVNTANDTTNAVTMSAGSRWSLKVVTSAGAATDLFSAGIDIEDNS